jgi:hypothetical protein
MKAYTLWLAVARPGAFVCEAHRGEVRRFLRATRLWRIVAIAALSAVPIRVCAQDQLAMVAQAIASYEASEHQCYYHEAVGRALAQVDGALSRAEPYRWQVAKRRAAEYVHTLTNVGRVLSQSNQGPGSARAIMDEWHRNVLRSQGRSVEPAPEPPPVSQAATDCKSLGLGVWGGLFTAMSIVGFDPTLVEEMSRLEAGGGRQR